MPPSGPRGTVRPCSNSPPAAPIPTPAARSTAPPEHRDDAAWIAAALAAPDTLWAPVWRSRNLLRGVAEGRPEAVFLTGAAAAALRMAGGPWAFLGLLDGAPLFAVDVSAAEDPLPLLPAEIGALRRPARRRRAAAAGRRLGAGACARR